MAYDPNFPPDHQDLNAAPFRNQYNALKALIDAQQAQIASLQQQVNPLLPVLNRDANGTWTLTYSGPPVDLWYVWVRHEGSPDWYKSGDIETFRFPTTDNNIVPDNVPWWQVKICGQSPDGAPITPFSNVISFGPVP